MTKKPRGRKKLSIKRGSLRKLTESESEVAAGGLPIAGAKTAGGCKPTETCGTCATCGCGTGTCGCGTGTTDCAA